MDILNLISNPAAKIPSCISIFMIGSIVGSFIATLVIRWPKAQSIIIGRSSCDQCGYLLHAIDLIPLISYTLLSGKCRYCNKSIDKSHWRTELLVAILSIIPFLILPPYGAFGWVLWLWLFIPLAILDYKYLWLPNRLIIITIIAAPFIGPLINDIDIINRLIGVIGAYLSLETIRVLYKKLRNKEAMGNGDPKLLAGLGFYFGWELLPYIILIASCIGLTIAVMLRVLHGYFDQEQKLPLGTYMIIAAPIGYAFTEIV